MLRLPERKAIELSQKLSGLDAEFAYWLDLSEATNAFEKHHTQVRAVVEPLRRLHGKIVDRLEEVARSPEALLAAGRGVERMVLATHRIWEFFRTKLAQRREDRLTRYLAAADEFAWACYEPVQARAFQYGAGRHRREPPLVFCNGGLSPFALSRDQAFQAEDVPNEVLSGPDLRSVLNHLPIAVVGVPWFQVRHLPDALVIGHEVGHAVEDDFRLTGAIEGAWNAALERSDPDRRLGWAAWRGELFADVYGSLCAGPAYVGALMDFLAGDRAAIAGEKRPASSGWGGYPTSHLRMQFNLAVLGQLGFHEDERRLGELWHGAYPVHAMPKYSEDISWLVEALLTTELPFGGDPIVALWDVIRFTTEQHATAVKLAGQLLAREGPLDDTRDVRVLFAAARLAYEQDPRGFYQHCTEPTCARPDCRHQKLRTCPERVLDRVWKTVAPGIRAPGLKSMAPRIKKRAEPTGALAAVGDDLFEELSRITASGEP